MHTPTYSKMHYMATQIDKFLYLLVTSVEPVMADSIRDDLFGIEVDSCEQTQSQAQVL